MGSLYRSGSRLVDATLLGSLFTACSMSACAQTRGSGLDLRNTVLIGVVDTAAHLHRDRRGNGPQEPTRRIIREQHALDTLWSILQEHFPAPRLDFSKEDVLVAGMGGQSAVGPTISIDTVLTRGAERIVFVRVTEVAEECLLASAYTYPIDIVVVPRDSTRTTRFVERTTRLSGCRPSPPAIRRLDPS
jgi:hypothetical protein